MQDKEASLLRIKAKARKDQAVGRCLRDPKLDNSLLVGGDWNMTSIFSYLGNFITPTDELIFFRGVCSTTNQLGQFFGQFRKKRRQVSTSCCMLLCSLSALGWITVKGNQGTVFLTQFEPQLEPKNIGKWGGVSAVGKPLDHPQMVGSHRFMGSGFPYYCI